MWPEYENILQQFGITKTWINQQVFYLSPSGLQYSGGSMFLDSNSHWTVMNISPQNAPLSVITNRHLLKEEMRLWMKILKHFIRREKLISKQNMVQLYIQKIGFSYQESSGHFYVPAHYSGLIKLAERYPDCTNLEKLYQNEAARKDMTELSLTGECDLKYFWPLYSVKVIGNEFMLIDLTKKEGETP